MIEAKVYNLKGNTKKTKITLPDVFSDGFRPDLIKRAVLSEQSKKRQKQGRFPLAGKLTTASSIGPGRGISKVPRTHGKKTHHASRAAS
ncbi:MAG: 50S ribosomal protein L4, partial [Candidatus Heimdallarchaeota archaeon]|nr:50S ribosomal protein L4 [Candidatus Heimdallarchaeota archaeon]